MRVYHYFLAALVMASAAFGASPDKPVMEGTEGQRAYDDLGKFYVDGGAVAGEEKAFADLKSADGQARAGAGRYLLALLEQSWADESNGRAEWKAQPFFGAGPKSDAREYRKALAEKIGDGPAAEELLDAELWLINTDLIAEDAAAGAKGMSRNPSPKIAGVYRALMSPAHPNTALMVTIIEDAARRKLGELGPEIEGLCNDPREKVRAAARAAAGPLGVKEPPAFDAEKAIGGVVENQLKDISGMVLTPIPKEAAWKRFSVKIENPRSGEPDHVEVSGWLVSQDKDFYHIVDYFGELVNLERAKTTVSDRTLAEEAEAILAIRTAKPKDDFDSPGSALSRRGGLTGQFEPGFVSLPEALVAAWSLERGDRKSAAALILPCFDRAEDERWIEMGVGDLLAKDYQQEMLDAFTHARNYAEALRIAHHLGKEQFKNWGYYDRTKELAGQLEKRTDDFKTLALPTPEEWKSLQQKLERGKQVEYLAQRLRLLNAFQWGQPGGVDFEEDQSRETDDELRAKPGMKRTTLINPLRELEQMQLEVKDLPSLLPFMEDENYVLAYGYWRDFHPGRTLYRVNGFVGDLINEAACRELIDGREFIDADAAKRKAMLDSAAEWIKANAGRTRVQLLLERLKNAENPREALAAAQELARKKEAAALPLLFERISHPVKDESAGDLAECCYHLDAAKSVEEARQWVKEGGDLGFWGAMILFTSGDKAKREGFAELKASLDGDDSELTRFKESFDVLLRSGDPEAMDLAASVVKHLGNDTRSWDSQAFLHRLFLAGRKEALDYLLASLDDKTAYGSTSGMIDGKEVAIELTRADEAAAGMDDMRTDQYRYPERSPEAQRAAEREKIKAWLKEQFALIQSGKPSAVQPIAPDFTFSHWTVDAPR